MRKMIIVVLILAVIFFATSFEEIIRGRTEIETLYPITLAGIDNNQNGDTEYLISTVSPTTEEDAVKPNNIMTVAGKTGFDANRNIGMYAENDLYWGYAKYILIGEEASKESVFKYLDFFMRDNEPRMTLTPLIVKGMSSRELIGLLYEQNIDISNTVDNIIDNYAILSYAFEMPFVEFIDLMSDKKNGYLPCFELEDERLDIRIEHGGQEPEEGETLEGEHAKILRSVGYAIIKDDKVIDYILFEQGRGLNWIIDEIVSGTIVVEHEGVKYNLEIIEGGSKIVPKIKDEKLKAEIKVNVDNILTEISKQDIAIDDELMKTLERKSSEIVKKEVMEVIDLVQKHEIDIIGIGDKFYHRYPVKWEKKYKEKWEDIFPKLDIEVTVDSTIERSARFYESILSGEVK
ncbi:Ger(x)C family spore germination protein [Alkalibaculum sp. M08DMB]|uniref:Ger(X)C family spore germination protein n=1 Tax=Alkalibaculum sporogenes TaxID=2655001 RepID=A0A6A7KCQ6_9FIRM|nr:Ger(x)C family spore germination protein [Alkalibaculum sporogenes]MPW27135.1 Ger(x)C family spore germination protein [Alkalibaculum sporogenes]